MLSDREDNVTLKFWVLSNGNVFWDYQAGEVTKAWFSYVGKITDDRRFYFLPTISDFADISDIHQRSVPDFPIMNLAGNRKCAKNRNLNTNVTAFQQFRGLVMSEIHRPQMLTSLMVQIWVFICREWSLIIAEIWDVSGKLKRSWFSRFVPVHPRRSEISTISSFH